MSLFMMRAGLLAQGSAAGPAPETGTPWLLDAARRPAGYALSDGDRTAINVTGGSDYRRWVPAARAILPTDGRRYWEVFCAPGGAASFDGYLGVVSAALRESFDAGVNPITLGSIGYRGDGSLWSSNATSASQRVTGLAPYGAGRVVMLQFDPGTAGLWVGVDGVWASDPVSGAPTWTAATSSAFYPQVQGRNAGEGGTLRSLPGEFSFAVPSGARPLAYVETRFAVLAADAWIECGGGRRLTAAEASLFIERDPS